MQQHHLSLYPRENSVSRLQNFYFKMIVIGVSAGALDALPRILSRLPAHFSIPLTIVCHVAANNNGALTKLLNQTSAMPIREIEDKQPIGDKYIAICPPNYHCYIEAAKQFALSVDRKENGCRPSIDCLFSSAADVFGKYTLGILLTGGNSDGIRGLQAVHAVRGCTIVQDPETAESPYLPERAIEEVDVDYIMNLDKIADFLIGLDLLS